MSKLINLRTFKEFFESSTGGGILLFICVVLALIVANSPLGDGLISLLSTRVGFENESIHLNYSIKQWIDDGLMAIFFLLVGLEIKRELVEGELASPKKAALPIIAAIGGALVPAGIYALFNYGTETQHGWGIPMATDIAFALAVISMLDKRVPPSLKVFLAALAIVDDLLAILVIALFYSSELHYTYLLYAGGIFALQMAFNKLGVKNILAYVIPGVFMWYFIHHSGIHATIAGVLTAMTLPTTPDAQESPLEKLEHMLAKPVNFIIIPLFAFVNTAIVMSYDMLGGLTSNMGLGIIIGLIVGKSVGILFTCWICVKSGLSALPEAAGWKHIFGVGLLGGIGFTMSIFVSMLSFSDPLFIEEAKLAILTASILAGLLGYFYLSSLNNKKV
ncbi:sodium/proton antiporter (NhaA family) [Sphingobacterium alimentarium]|uniref:Na(+)/H(+) antiporter NhaA n=1 Tax=Sphingobacterium alimentarium TaxID=797292 RepID=A0A4V2VTA3_9SPHI|nr:Na+/H+ antiporter NhaA [Sphingobacterium alimentarium]TCV05661.1 sodium/proton antiporter (NhaA family) [Sphingobacterium alimentarium]